MRSSSLERDQGLPHERKEKEGVTAELKWGESGRESVPHGTLCTAKGVGQKLNGKRVNI